MRKSIKWMAGNHVAANLLMMVFIIGGLIIGFTIKQEVFPEIALDMIRVSVSYPGAGPEEVEEGIILKLEERLSGISGIEEIRSRAREGRASVTLEVLDGEDVDEVLADVKAEVDRLTSLPGEAEKPAVSKIAFRGEVISVVVYGDVSERSLREYVETVQDEILDLPGITQVDVKGVRPYEIAIEVSEETLRAYGLTLQRIAERIRVASLDLPAGSMKTAGGEILIRTKEKRYLGHEYANITVIENPDGTEIKLGNIATVSDAFEDVDMFSHFDGKPSAMLTVYRVADQKPNDISRAVKEYVKLKSDLLPDSVRIATWNDRDELFTSRKQLLLRNAFLGLTLVLITLGLFLQVRLALWVMLGLPISFLGAMIFMPAIGVSINMISLFAFILVLGIVVDDAIIVGESIFEHRKMGKTYLQAAIDGTLEVAGPVIFAILSTVAAFVPLMYVSGNMGKFIKAIPLIVIPVLAVSLIECLYILPAHLTLGRQQRDSERKRTAFVRGRERFNDWLDRFIKGRYSRALGFCLDNRPIAIAVAIAVLLTSFGIVGGGIIKFRFMPRVESDVISASLEMPAGTMVDETDRALKYVVEKGVDTIREIDAETGDDTSVMRNVFSMVGSRLSRRHSNGVSTSGSNMAAIIMYLTPGEDRDITASEITARWRKSLGELPGVEALTFRTNMMDFGANIDVRLSHRDTDLLDNAAEALKKTIGMYPGVNNIEDSFSTGKRELTLRLRPEARTLGITEAELARQVRGAFHGVEALRLQRGRNEVRVIVRYPGEDRKTLANLENMYIRTPSGVGVPFSVAADIEESVGPTVIRRTDRKRVINVTADVDAKVANAEEINADLKEKTLTGLMVDYPGLGVQFEGEERQRTKSMNSMMRGFGMALFAIFIMLAIPFRSYSQPLVIMAAIPFGIIGGILGHLIMGYNLSMLSMFGFVALSGVVVNDSLLLIDHINRKRAEGMELHEAVIASGRRRFRPILLTSLTTFFGLAPMMLETSMQARFLIPMAISLAFGILFATVITLLLVPTLYTSLESVKLRLGFKPERLTGLMEEL